MRFAAVVGVLLGLTGAAAGWRILSSDGDPGGVPSGGRTTTTAPSTRSPGTTAPSAPSRGELLIHGTGDVNVDPGYIPNFREFGFGYAWSGLDGLFQRDDLTVINLECAVSDLGAPVPKEFNFRGDPAALPAMREAGVEVANLGNNHAYDYGPEALLDSRKNLIRNDIAPVGGGRDEAEATEAAFFEVDGWKVAVVGIAEVVLPEPESVAGPGHPGVACNDDRECMTGAVRRADERADLVVVSIHWGEELFTEPLPDQIDIAHKLIDAGADVIFGHHSHRLNPMGTYRGKPIFWSLGNFVWPNFSVAGSTTAVAEVTVFPSGKIRGRLLPAYIESAGHPVLR